MVVRTCNTSPKDRSLCDLASLVCMAKLDFKEADTKLKVGGSFLTSNKLTDAPSVAPWRLFQMQTLEPRADQLPRVSGSEPCETVILRPTAGSSYSGSLVTAQCLQYLL